MRLNPAGLIAILADTHMPKGARRLPAELEVEIGRLTVAVTHDLLNRGKTGLVFEHVWL